MKQKKAETNPMRTRKGAWLWLLCFPLAIAIDIHYELKKDNEKQAKKRREREKRQAEFYKDFDELSMDWDLDEYSKR